MPHEHRAKIVQFSHKLVDGDVKEYASLYGCLDCSETFEEKPVYEEEAVHDHTEYTDGCFACKIATLELGTGDAGRADSMPQKKWDKELSDFRSAHKQGIRPEGTSAQKIQEAVRASDNLGKAYNSETMMPAKVFDKKTARALQTSGLEI